ncbi:MAG: hypothetical protein M3N56_17080 [Actinomycetota bacterium]|nr:hypothetical protein [Actinomycetota bacterium]
MKRLAWGLWAVGVGVSLVIIVLAAGAGAEVDEALGFLLIGYATVGAMVAARHPENVVGWLLLVIALAFVVQSFGEAYVTLDDAPGRRFVGWTAGWLWYIWLACTGIFLPLVFPTGRLVSRRWRPAVWLGGAGLGLCMLGTAFLPGDLDLSAPVENPLGAPGALGALAEPAIYLGNVLAAVSFVLAGASVVLRIRRARGVERAQVKWFALVGLLMTLALGLAMLEILFPGGWRLVAGTIGWYSFLGLALIGIPAATGIAILRHGLYDIDVVIRRTLVYAALTATLAGGYLGGVLLAQVIIGAESSFAIALSTLAMAALFRPARARIQALVDRRFYRRRYDATLTLERFGFRLRDELDLEALGADLRGVVRETMQPASVSLWLRSRE